MTTIVGDTVTWRSGKSTHRGRGIPIGIANCRVLGFGVSEDDKPAATIKLPRQYLGENWPETVGALVADLEKD